MKTITLEVTQRDIDRAIAWKSRYKRNEQGIGYYNCNCVVANAAKRHFRNPVNVQGISMSVTKVHKPTYYNLDEVGHTLTKKFDEDKFSDVKPCTVVLTKWAS